MDKPQIEAFDTLPELPLPVYASHTIGSMRMSDGTALSVVFGLSKEMAEALKAHALDDTDEELQKNTSDRARFGTGSYEDWYAKDRYPFALVTDTGALAALIWLGPQAFPGEEAGEWDTMAFRSYVPYRGKGIMTPFGRFAIQTYLALKPGHRIWLETDATNAAAIGLYEKLGFVSRGYRDGTERLLMTSEA